MSDATQVQPGQRDPNMPRGRILIVIAAIALGSFMYVIYPGHGPMPGHVAAPPASATPG